MVEFVALDAGDEAALEAMSALATGIVREHYDPIIGREQNDYMLERFQSVRGIREQLEHGCNYRFVRLDGRDVGFLAWYRRDDHLYLSKLYLKKDVRGRGLGRQMVGYVRQRAQEAGLREIRLNVNRNNSTVRIYEKMGFQVIREEKNDIGHGFYMDDFVFSLRWQGRETPVHALLSQSRK